MATLGHPCKFQRVSRLGSVTARQSSSERQANFVALNRGRHLCSAGRPSRWALAHILVSYKLQFSPRSVLSPPCVQYVYWTTGSLLVSASQVLVANKNFGNFRSREFLVSNTEKWLLDEGGCPCRQSSCAWCSAARSCSRPSGSVRCGENTPRSRQLGVSPSLTTCTVEQHAPHRFTQ